MPNSWGGQITIVVGELSDPQAIDRAVHGVDAIVSALGPSLDRKATGMPLVESSSRRRRAR